MKRRRIFRALAASLWLVALALLGEALARAYEHRSAEAAATYAERTDLRQVREAYHASLWRKSPNGMKKWSEYQPGARVALTADGIDRVASINSAGFRGAEWPCRPGSVKVACLGASTTVVGDTDDSTYPARLERALRERGHDAEVWNCGVAGIPDARYGEVVDRILARSVPDVVVEYNCVNDICWFALPAWQGRLAGWQRFLLGSALARIELGDAFLPDEATIRRDLASCTIRHLDALASKLRERGSRLAVATFIHPDVARLSREDRARFDGNFRYHWRAGHVSFAAYARIVDLYDDELERTFAGSDVVVLPLARTVRLDGSDFEDICHLRQSGLEKQARAVADLLEPVLRR